MKKWLPWVIPSLFAVWIVVTLQPPAEKRALHLDEFGKLPVLLNGRIQPLDSVARNSLLIIRTRQTLQTEDGKTLSAIEWLAEAMMNATKADDRKIFRIDHPDLHGMLHLAPKEKYFSFNQVKDHWKELEEQSKRIEAIEAELRSPFERNLLQLRNSMGLYFSLKNSLKPEGAEDFKAELALFEKSIGPGVEAVHKSQTGEDYNEQDLYLMAEFFKRYSVLSEIANPLMIPPRDSSETNDWKKVGASLLESMRQGEVHPAIEYYASMASAYGEDRPEEFNQAVTQYREWLDSKGFDQELAKGRTEFFYNYYQPFYKSSTIYVFAFLLGCISWFNWSHWLNRSAFRLVLLALIVHTSGLIFRMTLEGRPPVTNLYSSAIFVGWGAAVLGAVLERVFRDGIGTVVASTVGFLSLVIAHNLALGGDTMQMLQAVLDTNFWLATHVVVITLGYSSVFVSGFLAIIYIFRGLFTRSLTGGTAKSLSRMVYGIVCFSTLFSFVGTVLGGIWADQSWGRFWGWDPKENGALMIVIWCAIILHARWGGMIRDRGLMAMAVFGNVVTAFSWFGVNMLGVGLHAYGFMDQAFKWLLLFTASQLLIIGLACIPQRFWRSYRALQQPGKVPPSPSASTKETVASR